MGYLFLAIALAGGFAKAFCGKKISTKMQGTKDTLIVNAMRMLICCVIGFIIAFGNTGNIGVFKLDFSFFLISFISGIFSALFVILWLIVTKSGAYAMVDTFIMMGTLIPMLGSTLLFNEHIRPIQWVGFAIVVTGVLILCSYNNSVKTKLTVKSVILLLGVGASSGLADLSQKLFTYICEGKSNAVFNFYTYVFAAVVIIIALLFQRAKPKYVIQKAKSLWIYVAIMAAGLFINSFFKVEAAYLIDASKLYPLNQGTALALGAIMASVFFGEKITYKCVIGLLLGFAGICMINMF